MRYSDDVINKEQSNPYDWLFGTALNFRQQELTNQSFTAIFVELRQKSQVSRVFKAKHKLWKDAKNEQKNEIKWM